MRNSKEAMIRQAERKRGFTSRTRDKSEGTQTSGYCRARVHTKVKQTSGYRALGHAHTISPYYRELCSTALANKKRHRAESW